MKSLKALSALCASAFLLAACNTGGGTDVGNPDIVRVSGSLLHRDGTPVPFVPVHLRPQAFYSNPDSAPIQTGKRIQDGFTDTQGFFALDSVPRGRYRIEAVDTSGQGAIVEVFQDGLNEHITFTPVFMDTTGWISGKVNYVGPPQSSRPKIFISVFGMDRWTAANTAGDFTLSDLPAGTYNLRIFTNVNGGMTAFVDSVRLEANGRSSVGTVDLGP